MINRSIDEMQKQRTKQVTKKQSKQYEEVKTNMSKRILAVVLAFALVFSTFTVAFADEAVSSDVKALAGIGMLIGDGNGVTVEYAETIPSRLQSAILFLRLRGLESEAVAFEGEENFSDAKDYAWAEGKAIMAYLKAHPELGWIGDAGEFMPGKKINEQSYYKVLLEALGYKQNTGTVVGDFDFAEVFEFAKSVGLEPENLESFTIDNLAKATIAALKLKTVDGKLLVEVLIENGKIDKEAAIENGLYEEAIAADVKSVKAIGNTVVEVEFEEEVDARFAENEANYEIAGLDIKAASLAGEEKVRLETSAMTAGKLYTLKINEGEVKFTGVAKVSGAPAIEKVESADIEEVVISFDKALDFETAADVENYAIAGIEVLKAEVDGKEVTLTTEGLVARKQYTVKVTNVKSVDGGLLKSASKSFYTRPDATAPTVKGEVDVQTNQRLVVTFNKKVTKESAEDLDNYTITAGTEELAILEAIWDSEDEDSVELTTEVQAANKRYEISVSNISDQTKAQNIMKKTVKKSFYGKREDTIAPSFQGINVVSRNHIEVSFSDASRFDETTVLDVNNYTLTKSSEDYAVDNAEKISYKNGVYKVLLTVADLDLGSYNLAIVDIADEFDNVMKEVKRVFSVSRDSFASASVSGYEISDVDTIKVTFTKSLNKATAEDLANYTFDSSIGAPIKAKYEDKVVTLTTAKFVEGKEYKLTIKGVEDLAGNVLNQSFKFIAKKGTVDKETPKLVDIYSVNEYVVAVVFDEAVEYSAGTVLNLSPELQLKAKAYAEDKTVIEFSAAALDEAVKLNAVNGYTIAAGSLTGIKDKAGNAFNVAEANLGDYVIYGNDSEAEAPEVLSIAQINGTTFQVTMSKNVIIKNSAPIAGWTVVYDDSDVKDVVNFVKSSKISESTEYVSFNLSVILTDEHGIAAKNLDKENETYFYVEYEDTEKPYIVDVVAVNRNTVEVEYSEELKADAIGSYIIKNADEDIKTSIANSASLKSNGKVVKLTLTTPLEGRYDYRLIIGSVAAQDLAGNTAEESKDDEFYFNGTDLVGLDENSLLKPGVKAAVMSFVDGEGEEASEAPANVEAVVAEAGTKVTFTVPKDSAETMTPAFKMEKVVVTFLASDTKVENYTVKLVSGTNVPEGGIAEYGVLAKNEEVWEMTSNNPQTFMTAGTWNLSVEVVKANGNRQVIDIVLVVE